MTPITPDRMTELMAMPDEESEPILFNRLQEIAHGWELSYLECGLICRAVDAYLLWEHHIDAETDQPCDSFSRWIHICCPRSYSSVYAAMRDVEALQDIPEQQLAKVQTANVGTLKQLSTAVRNDPKVLEAAQTQRNDQFVDHIREHHPEQAIEHRRLLRFQLEDSAAERVEAVIETAIRKGAKNWSEALEMIAEEAADVWRVEAEIEEALSHEQNPEGQVRPLQ